MQRFCKLLSLFILGLESFSQSILFTGKVDFSNYMPQGTGKEFSPLLLNSSDYAVRDVAFDEEGLSLFFLSLTSKYDIVKYSLSSPFDIESATGEETYDFPGVIGTTGLYFTKDGNKLFISLGNGQIRQYSLSVPYQISTGITLENIIDVSSEESLPQDLMFSPDGLKLFVIGNGNNRINQYSLDASFDLSNGLTWQGSFDVSVVDSDPVDLLFDATGKKIFIAGRENNMLYQFSLNDPFDITSGVMNDNAPFDLLTTVDFVAGITFNTDLTSLFVLSNNFPGNAGNGGYVTQLTTSSTVFYENAGADDGSLYYPDEVIISLINQRFVFPGSFLEEGDDFEIHNLPEGLFADFLIDDSGTFGTLSFSGNAINNSDADDVEGLVFTFNDSAFKDNDAASVDGASNTITTFAIDFVGIPLPVELLYFDGYSRERSIDLKWATLTETNNDYFELYHSASGAKGTFSKIATLIGAGNSNQEVEYEHTHYYPSHDKNYYQLKQVDHDGSSEYSDIILVDGSNDYLRNTSFKVYPNPSTLEEGLFIRWEGSSDLNTNDIRFYSNSGIKIPLTISKIGKNLFQIEWHSKTPDQGILTVDSESSKVLIVK